MTDTDKVMRYLTYYHKVKFGKDDYIKTLEKKLRDLQTIKPGYSVMAETICIQLEQEGFKSDNTNVQKGDRVVGIDRYGERDFDGLKGKVVHITSKFRDNPYGIEWVTHIGGHDCDEYAKDGYGYYIPRENFRRLGRLPEMAIDSKHDYEKFLETVESILLESAEIVDGENNVIEIGGKVEMFNTRGIYPVTGDGSWGYLERKKRGKFLVKFHHLTGLLKPVPQSYWVDPTLVRPKSDERDVQKLMELAKEIQQRAEDENHLTEYEERRKAILEESIPRMRSYEMADHEIILFFRTFLSDLEDLREMLGGIE